MTFDEIQAEIYRLKALMGDAELAQSHVKMEMSDFMRPQVNVYGEAGLVGEFGVENFPSDDIREALANAEAFIRSLPTAEKRSLAKYRAKLAEALDIAADGQVADDITAGARESMTAVSELLLEGPK